MKHSALIIISLLVLILVSFNISSLIRKNRLLKEDLARLTQRALTTQQEKSRLTNLIKEGETQAEKEREVRLMLGYKKKGEKVVLVVPPSTISSSSVESTSSSPSLTTNLLSFWKQTWYNIRSLFHKL